MSLRERAYLSLKFYNRPIAVGIPAFLFFFFLLYSFPFFLLLITVRTDIDSYLCGFGFLLIFFLFLFLFCLATKIQHTKCQFRDWIIHWDFVTFICSFHPFIVQPRNRERKKSNLPFCRISRCSQRISPMKGGVRARKFSLPMAHMSRPRMRKCCSTTPSSENSLMAQLSQRETSLSDHNRGSGLTRRSQIKNQFKKQLLLLLLLL